MPARIARSSVQIAAPKTARNKNRKRNLDAYFIASHSAPDKTRVKPSRLGEVLDDGPRQKRRRDDEDEDAEEEEDERDVPAKRRRPANVDEEEGSDSEGNEWTLGGMKEDDGDSELDSDEAFGESDEEKFEGFAFRGSKSGQNTRKPARTNRRPTARQDEVGGIDLDEAASANDEDEDDEFGEDGVDLATMLDDNDEKVLGGKDTTDRDVGEESASDDEEQFDSDSESDDDNDTNEEERVARMRDRLEALDSASQPPTTAPSQQPAALTVDDLLATLDPASKAQFASALKIRGKKSSRPATLTAPLPKRQQDKLDREVASAKAKEQLDRWRDTVIQNRRAEFLSFPLKDPSRAEPQGKERFVVAGEEEPQNELEENIRRIMIESGLASAPGAKKEDQEAALIKSEELATNKLPVEEVLRRRAELRKTRELLFREEIKAKRIAKIKSKAYRRVHRREKQRQRGLLGGDSDDEDVKEKADRKRAEARMGARHRDSKFAKSLRQTDRNVWDEGAKEGVIEEARRREDLRKRIHGEEIGSGDEGSDVSMDSDGDGDEDAGTLKQLSRLKHDGGEDGRQGKGLGSMPFMRAADERQRARNDEDVERLRHELAVEDGDEADSEEDATEDQGLGRAIFGPKGWENPAEVGMRVKRPEMEEGDDSADEDGGERDGDVEIVTERSRPQKGAAGKKSAIASGPLAKGSGFGKRNPAQRQDEEEQEDESSWLAFSTKSKRDQQVVDDRPEGSDWLGVPKKSKRDKQLQNGAEDEAGIHVMANSLSTTQTEEVSRTKKFVPANAPPQRNDAPNAEAGNTDGWTTVTTHDDQPSDVEFELEETEPSNPIVTPSEQKAAIMRQAFAGDDAVQTSFEAEKADLAASEDEKETSNYLPGWGSWTGDGLSKSIRKSNARQRHNPLYKSSVPGGVKAADRKDARLENVIVSEKLNRKGKVYQAPILPHGFETKQQYERSLRVPVGPEWTTKEVFQRGTRPRVVVKPGTVVEAMERPWV